MKKKRWISFLFILSIFLSAVTFFYNNNELKLTNEEQVYIENNKETIFLVGYFPTAAERRFCEKLCQQIETDTGLKFRIYSDSWNNTLTLLQRGRLPVVMNMNKTPKRQEYTLFTSPLKPIDCGIYSGEKDTILSFADIQGKVIGVEKETALSESFPAKYPELDYQLKIYDTFEETRQGFENQEIDGFLSTKSYDDNVKGLHFFKVESITVDTNHIGVSKEYPELYSILSKEIALLKSKKWDIEVLDVINYELEKSLVDFNVEEKAYLDKKDLIKVGLPIEYDLYVRGSEYYPEGALAKVLEKIEFISTANFAYEFDSLENLRLREDIDVYIDYEKSKHYTSKTIFNEEIIILGTSGTQAINEIYELSIHKVGLFGVPKAKEMLRRSMPELSIQNFDQLNLAANAIKKEEIDYLIMPRRYYETVFNSHSLHGNFQSFINRFVSDDPMLIEILDKCLFIIDTEMIVDEIVRHEIPKLFPYGRLIGLVVLILGLVVTYKIYQNQYKRYYFDKQYGVYNMSYLEKDYERLPKYFIAIRLEDIDEIRLHHGLKILKKYMGHFIRSIEKILDENAYLFFLHQDILLIAHPNRSEDMLSQLSKISSISTNEDILKYNKSICFYESVPDELLQETYVKLLSGLKISKKEEGVLYLTNERFQSYKQQISNEIILREKIIKNDMQILYSDVWDKNQRNIGSYAQICVENMKLNQSTLGKIGLSIEVDKYLLSHVLKSSKTGRVFVRISEMTLKSDCFFEWLTSYLNESLELVLLLKGPNLNELLDFIQPVKGIAYGVEGFGQALQSEHLIKYHPISYIIVSPSLYLDIEENEEIICFIESFAKRHQKKIVSQSFNGLKNIASISEGLIQGPDYFIGGEYFETANRRR